MKTIHVKGPIISNGEKWIYDWFGEDATCPRDVINELPEDGSEVLVIINSGGGYVDCGNEIYTALKSYGGMVTVDIIEACSAASVIAMAGNPTRITPVGRLMIHNTSMGVQGDYHVMDKSSEMLQKANQSISAAYQIKTGLSRDELLIMMDDETWMTAEEALKKGFVDEILFQNESVQQLVANCRDMLPTNIIQKMQNMKQSNMLESGTPGINQAMIEKVVENVLLKQQQQQKQNNSKKEEPINPIVRFLF